MSSALSFGLQGMVIGYCANPLRYFPFWTYLLVSQYVCVVSPCILSLVFLVYPRSFDVVVIVIVTCKCRWTWVVITTVMIFHGLFLSIVTKDVKTWRVICLVCYHLILNHFVYNQLFAKYPTTSSNKSIFIKCSTKHKKLSCCLGSACNQIGMDLFDYPIHSVGRIPKI